VTTAEIAAFADLTRDRNPLHVDAEFAAAMPYGQIIAHGILGLSLGNGLIEETGVHSGTSIALLGVNDWSFKLPIIAGDTIRARATITGKRLSQKDPSRGILTRRMEILNQRDELVQAGEQSLLVRTRLIPAPVE
jgi:acyl dehydratase